MSAFVSFRVKSRKFRIKMSDDSDAQEGWTSLCDELYTTITADRTKYVNIDLAHDDGDNLSTQIIPIIEVFFRNESDRYKKY